MKSFSFDRDRKLSIPLSHKSQQLNLIASHKNGKVCTQETVQLTQFCKSERGEVFSMSRLAIALRLVKYLPTWISWG